MATYGSINEKDSEIVEMDKFNQNPFNETFDDEFWENMTEQPSEDESTEAWCEKLLVKRVDNLLPKYPSITDLLEIHTQFHSTTSEITLKQSFDHQLCHFIIDYIKRDKVSAKPKYHKLIKLDGNRKNILHLTAEKNLWVAVKFITTCYPKMVYQTSVPENLLPLEVGIENNCDESASVIAKIMSNERLRQLFIYDEGTDSVKLSFSELTAKAEAMKRTTRAVLDSMITAEYPFMPTVPDKDAEETWSKVKESPRRFKVDFRLLDGDEKGRSALQENFNKHGTSGLYNLTSLCENQEFLAHPAVKLCYQRKWQDYGFRVYVVYSVLQFTLILSMALAFLLPTSSANRTVYETNTDYARAVFEVITYVINIMFFVHEIDQIVHEKWSYFTIENCLDVTGILLVFSLPFVKFMTVNAVPKHPSSNEWCVMAFAFLINTLLLLKRLPINKELGIYYKTFTSILIYDISKFFLVYCLVTVAFFGCIYLLLKSKTDALQAKGLNMGLVFLSEIRALVEGKEFADDYDGYRVLTLLVILVNMFVVIVIMANILIGQISQQYDSARELARVQHSIDRGRMVTMLEIGVLSRLFNHRQRHYVDFMYLSNTDMVQAMKDDWDMWQKETGEQSQMNELVSEFSSTFKKDL